MNNINVTVKLDDADKATLDKMLEIVGSIYLAIATQNEPVQNANTKIASKDTVDTVTDATVTLEQVRAVLADKSRAGFTGQVRELLLKYGAAKLSEIPQSRYADLLSDAEGLENA